MPRNTDRHRPESPTSDQIPSLVLVIAMEHGLESLEWLTSHFSIACTTTSIRFATEWLPREAEQCQCELLNVRTISLCCDFVAVRNVFGSSIYISFLLELRS